MAGLFALALMSMIVTVFIIVLHTKKGREWLKSLD